MTVFEIYQFRKFKKFYNLEKLSNTLSVQVIERNNNKNYIHK